ncbi:uncharacterized protein LOC131301934 [Rhododendron vialii]|uniref:uncharacterized protein LOC131301934 n=1 Tax=Rhododendron vialii TaxID=182163 RepID=UPI00265EA2C6|nr:uncharacterized protein LOC131301934 [Rhododendron vialii]XP_058184431.1 uncharacterized protein LOC131301934 [Rhododendron vialii]
MALRNLQNLIHCTKYVRRRNMAVRKNLVLYHCSEESREGNLPSEWYEQTFPKLIELTHLLKNVDSVDGRLINIDDHSIVIEDSLQQSMHTFKSLARAFLGSPTVQQALTTQTAIPRLCFTKPYERGPMTISSLTKVCNFLNISAQQRKLIRLAICPQVTQHQIWTGTLEEILTGLKSEIKLLGHHTPNKGIYMGQQIVHSCLKFLDAAVTYDPNSTSWMRLSPSKVSGSPVSHKWENILEMFNDLMNCLRKEKEKLFHFPKLEVMKEGLLQIKDVVVDKNIRYRETRHQESLVQKKLTKTLGHSSRCLFTLLMFYLYGSVVDVEVDICGGIYENGGKDRFCLCMGKFLTSGEEKTVQSGVKQLDRALGLFKYVWETAGMKGDLELQGHLWCVGAEETSVAYRGNRFFIHGIRF